MLRTGNVSRRSAVNEGPGIDRHRKRPRTARHLERGIVSVSWEKTTASLGFEDDRASDEADNREIEGESYGFATLDLRKGVKQRSSY